MWEREWVALRETGLVRMYIEEVLMSWPRYCKRCKEQLSSWVLGLYCFECLKEIDNDVDVRGRTTFSVASTSNITAHPEPSRDHSASAQRPILFGVQRPAAKANARPA